jgi:hypothetical protein
LLVIALLLLGGCSRAVEIPPGQVDDPQYQAVGSYRIRLQGREEYLVRRFSVTDSTVAIEELHPSDQRFRFGREKLPITVARERVLSVSIMKPDILMTTLAGVGVAALAYFVFLIFTFDYGGN